MLADDLFRIAHHQVTGRPWLTSRVMSLGLSAALLGELVGESLAEVGDTVVVLRGRPVPGDLAQHAVVDDLSRERGLWPTRDWLALLADRSTQRVASRLTRSGDVTVQRSRFPLRGGSVTYVPTSMPEAARPWVGLLYKLQRGSMLTGLDAVLAALVQATGLDRMLLDGAHPDMVARFTGAVGYVPLQFRPLVTELRAAVGGAVLAHRT